MISPIPTITIDGPSGSGKGVISQILSATLGFHLLDSGALYRVLGVAARRLDLDLDLEPELTVLAARMNVEFKPTGDPESPLLVIYGGDDITRQLRTDAAGVDASRVAQFPDVRLALRDLQRSFRKLPGLIADGRDMGTLVFADADLKIYLTATAEERAKRRYKQLKDKDIDVRLLALLDSIRDRDKRDMERSVAPLRPADDAVIVDSSLLSIDAVIDQILQEAARRGIKAG